MSRTTSRERQRGESDGQEGQALVDHVDMYKKRVKRACAPPSPGDATRAKTAAANKVARTGSMSKMRAARRREVVIPQVTCPSLPRDGGRCDRAAGCRT
eukprot:5812474-Prymnesium_polylepis.1